MIYKKGSPKSEVVKQIQKALNLYPDGIFGRLTEEAVKEFQFKHGLKVDGIVGPATLSMLLPFVLNKSNRKITEIIVHCTATPEGKDYTVDTIRSWHIKKGFSDIGYHYVIDLEGKIHLGRDVNIAGAHVAGHNSNSIGVVYIGGMDKNNKPKDTRTDNQKGSLISLLMDLKKLYPNAKILGHRDCSKDLNGNGLIEPNEWIKDCPCFNAKEEYRKL